MKRYIYLMLLIFVMAGCESNSMCSTNEDCVNMCRTYDNNSIMYACEEGNCKCVDESKLKCAADESMERCEAICSRYRPGTTASCVSETCQCLESVEEE